MRSERTFWCTFFRSSRLPMWSHKYLEWVNSGRLVIGGLMSLRWLFVRWHSRRCDGKSMLLCRPPQHWGLVQAALIIDWPASFIGVLVIGIVMLSVVLIKILQCEVCNLNLWVRNFHSSWMHDRDYTTSASSQSTWNDVFQVTSVSFISIDDRVLGAPKFTHRGYI